MAENHPNIVVSVVLAILVFDTAAGGFTLIELHDQQARIAHDVKHRAYELCVTSNDARRSLRGLLLFAEQRTRQAARQGGSTPAQLRDALDFYDKALERIKIIPCPKP